MAQQEKKKSRKQGRNKPWCEMYRARGRRDVNKAQRMLATLSRQPCNHKLWQAVRTFWEQNPIAVRDATARRERLGCSALANYGILRGALDANDPERVL